MKNATEALFFIIVAVLSCCGCGYLRGCGTEG